MDLLVVLVSVHHDLTSWLDTGAGEYFANQFRSRITAHSRAPYEVVDTKASSGARITYGPSSARLMGRPLSTHIEPSPRQSTFFSLTEISSSAALRKHSARYCHEKKSRARREHGAYSKIMYPEPDVMCIIIVSPLFLLSEGERIELWSRQSRTFSVCSNKTDLV